MKSLTLTQFCKVAFTLSKTAGKSFPVLITSGGKNTAVVLSAAQYEKLSGKAFSVTKDGSKSKK